MWLNSSTTLGKAKPKRSSLLTNPANPTIRALIRHHLLGLDGRLNRIHSALRRLIAVIASRPSRALLHQFASSALLERVSVSDNALLEFEGILAWSKQLDLKMATFVDIASSDGVTQSALWPLFCQAGNPAGLCVEVDVRKFAQLSTIYQRFPGLVLARTKISPHNVALLVESVSIPKEFDLLNLDIDSFDLDVLGAVLESGFRPSIITMEINEKIPPPIYFSVNYAPDRFWRRDLFFGCSLSAALEELAKYPYTAVELLGNNLLIIRIDLLAGDFIAPSAHELYFQGYVNRENRKTMFPDNRHADIWLNLNPENAMKEILREFSAYPQSDFTLRLSQ